MDTYNFSYRRLDCTCNKCKSFLKFLYSSKLCEKKWKSIEVIGHGPENFTDTQTTYNNGEKSTQIVNGQDRNKMVLYFKNGAIQTISNWNNCEIKLDTDWVLFTKNKMEKQTGQDIKLAVNAE